MQGEPRAEIKQIDWQRKADRRLQQHLPGVLSHMYLLGHGCWRLGLVLSAPIPASDEAALDNGCCCASGEGTQASAGSLMALGIEVTSKALDTWNIFHLKIHLLLAGMLGTPSPFLFSIL